MIVHDENDEAVIGDKVIIEAVGRKIRNKKTFAIKEFVKRSSYEHEFYQHLNDPKGIEAERAIKIALKESNLVPDAIDYINLHGTGTKTNDLMEANALYKLFGCCTEVSATKPLTGHCLGAAASIETALCCHIIKNNTIIPHVYDGEYDYTLPEINLITKPVNKKINNVLCNAFGFGGTNAVMIMGRE